jgi:hypothetical protein
MPRLDPDAAARHWLKSLESVDTRTQAQKLYSGRGFQQAVSAAASLAAPLLIASAGLGLVASESLVPAYDATVAPGTSDSICAHLGTSPKAWWRSLTAKSGCRWPTEEVVLLIALSGPYLEMLEADLLGRPPEQFRLFTRTPPERLHPRLRASLMPYDARFDAHDGPCPGTIGDFAQRALAHFSKQILPGARDADVAQHRELVLSSLFGLTAPSKRAGKAAADEELRAVIRTHYTEVGGRSTRMLRRLRDDLGLACEQSRFSRLFREVEAGLGGGAPCLPL